MELLSEQLEQAQQVKIDVTANEFYTSVILGADNLYIAIVNSIHAYNEYPTGVSDKILAECYALGFGVKEAITLNLDATVYISMELKKFYDGMKFDANNHQLEHYMRLILMAEKRYHHLFEYQTFNGVEYQRIRRLVIRLEPTALMREIWTKNFKNTELKGDYK